jgi:pyruvate formate-lyase activating enzyme-like uncharacterized protein
MKQWDEMCIDYRNNEENIEVVDETRFKIELEPPKNLDSLATSSSILNWVSSKIQYSLHYCDNQYT